MTQRCWAGYVALWSWSPPPMIPLESESRTQTSVQALSSHPQLAAPGQLVTRWGWQFPPPMRFQKFYIDQIWQNVFKYTQVKSIGGHLRQRLSTARCDVQHNMMTSQNELDSIRLMISMRKWFCWVVGLTKLLPGAVGEHQGMVFPQPSGPPTSLQCWIPLSQNFWNQYRFMTSTGWHLSFRLGKFIRQVGRLCLKCWAVGGISSILHQLSEWIYPYINILWWPSYVNN